METITLAKGEFLVHKGETVRNVFIVARGSIIMETMNDRILLKGGGIVGLVEAGRVGYVCDYRANEDTTLVSYPYRNVNDLRPIFEQYPKYQYAFVHGAIIQCGDLVNRYEKVGAQLRFYYNAASAAYRKYHTLCETYDLPTESARFEDKVGMPNETAKVEDWEVAYNKAFAEKDTKLIQDMYGEDMDLCIGEIAHACGVMYRSMHSMEERIEYMFSNRKVIIAQDGKDYLGVFVNLRKRLAERGLDQTETAEYIEKIFAFCAKAYVADMPLFDKATLEARIKEYQAIDFDAIKPSIVPATEQQEDMSAVANELLVEEEDEDEEEEGADCLATILEYAQKSEEEIEEIRGKIAEFRDLPDIYATDDETRALRRWLTNMFFEVYEKAFFRSLEENEEELDEILLMFFNFGFMDVQLVGEENANALYELTERLYLCRSAHVYTMYDWLKRIYIGDKEPSKSEFDLDYGAYLREQVKTGDLRKSDIPALMSNQVEKVKYELNNMFKSVNRVTYGRFSTYCPIIREDDFIKSVQELLVTCKKLDEAMNVVRQIDYTCFLREMQVADEEHDLPRIEIRREVLPDIILMPNVGTKGMMWQENADTKRDTPGRFMFPIFTAGDINDMMVESCGRFRWEICRKVQGMRWNDIRELSLTSEYCDYLQFYRKNRDLSSDAKEKVKNSLQKAKNNYREVFVRDYVNWIKFEAKGSVRLNRVARDIIFRYCPFTKETRVRMAESPMFRESISKFEVKNAREAEKMNNVFKRYEAAGGELIPEMKEFLDTFLM